MILVSVVICSKNNDDTIDACLDSILRQEGLDSELEIVVVDAVSTDNTEAILSKYCSAHPGLLRVVRDSGTSLTKARNIGLHSSRGIYMVHLDADYLLHSQAIRRCLQYMHSAYDAVVFKEGILVGMGRWREIRSWDNVIKSLYGKLAEPLGKGSGYPRFFRRDFLLALGGHNEDIEFYCEDAELTWRAFRSNAKIKYASDAIYYKIEEKDVKGTWRKHFNYGTMTPSMMRYSRRYTLATVIGSNLNTFLPFLSFVEAVLAIVLSRSAKIALGVFVCSYVRMAAEFVGTVSGLLKLMRRTRIP